MQQGNNKVIDRQYNLFDNPAVVEAKSKMSAEEIRAYERYGELAMSVNYDDATSGQTPDYVKTAAKAYIDVLLNGACTEAQMTKEELDVIESVYGAEWRKLLV